MTMRVAGLAGLMSVALLVGCSYNPGQKVEPVTVSGVVLLPSGQPVRNVTVNFFPTSPAQMQGGARLKEDGKFSAQLTPGKYSYAFEGATAHVKPIPTKYYSNDPAHSFEVPPTGTSGMTIQLKN